MELRHLRYFVTVAEHLNFRVAAKALATAQPSLSQQIRQLEMEVGTPLFRRNNRYVELTAAGHVFLADARRALKEADATLREVRQLGDVARGDLRVAFVPGAMFSFLPSVFREFRMQHPNVNLLPTGIPAREHREALHKTLVDVACAGQSLDPELECHILREEPVLVALAASHPLAGNEPVAIRELAGNSLIVLADSIGPVLNRTILRLCLSEGFHPDSILEVDNEATILALVAAGYGVAIVPQSFFSITIAGLVFRSVTASLSLPTALSRLRSNASPLVASFVGVAVKVVAAYEHGYSVSFIP